MKIAEISKKRLALLNMGRAETAHLSEWLAVDQKKLLLNLGSELNISLLKNLSKEIPKVSAPKQIAWVGMQLYRCSQINELAIHHSDIARCWVCYAKAAVSSNLKEALSLVKPFAKDKHFGVREISWMTVREKICENPQEAIELLIPWAKDKNENIRRFSSEATRPRGVWAKHIQTLKKNPDLAKPLLDILFTDSSRYVQDSVANWLNDAAKDNPHWVMDVTKDWRNKSSNKETLYIIKKATRSFK